MTSYRRNFVPGDSYFFTVNPEDRRSRLLTERVDLLRQAFRQVRARYPFMLDAIVVLPEHLHAIWTLPPGDADFAVRRRLIKASFSRGIETGEADFRQPSTQRRARYLAAPLLGTHDPDERDFERHCDYIHFNPVKRGLANSARQWPHSSFP
jgi:putative transposase